MTAPPHDRLTRLARVPVYVIATIDADPEPLTPVLRAAAKGGMGAVQLRWKRASTEARRAVLATWRTLLPGVLLIVDDDLEAADDDAGRPLADGVHLGRADAALMAGGPTEDLGRRVQGLAIARARLGPERLLGTSARDLDEVERGLAGGADHFGFGAMATSTTKADTTRASLGALATCLAKLPDCPLFPIGGVDLALARQLAGVGCPRAAVGAAVMSAPNPTAAIRTLRQALEGRSTP